MKDPVKANQSQATLESVREELAVLRHRVATLERRLDHLEVKEELQENPSASGDEPVDEYLG